MASPRAATLLSVVLRAKETARPELSRRLVGMESPVVFWVARMVRQSTERPLRISSLGQGDAAAGETFKGAVAAVLGEVEVGLALIENRDQERQVVGGAAGVPGVPLSAQRHDVAEAAAHFGVLVLEYVEGVGELVAGVAPGAFVPGLLVAAVFAVQERELGGGCRCELAQPGVDEAGLP
jgi:hypothetical protein